MNGDKFSTRPNFGLSSIFTGKSIVGLEMDPNGGRVVNRTDASGMMSNAGTSAGVKKAWESRNHSYGFHGTVSGNDMAKNPSFKKMHDVVHPDMRKVGGDEQDTRNFLDSTHGRHLADAVNDGQTHEDAWKSYGGDKHKAKILKGVKDALKSFDEEYK